MPENEQKTYTEADIRDRFISKDVFADRMQGKTARISELEAKIGDYQKQLLEAQPRLASIARPCSTARARARFRLSSSVSR